MGRLLLPRLPLPLLLRQFSTALRVAKRRVGLSGKFDKCAEIGFQLFGLADNHLCVCAQPLLPVPPQSTLQLQPVHVCQATLRKHTNLRICPKQREHLHNQRGSGATIRSDPDPIISAVSSNNNNSSSRGSHWRELKGCSSDPAGMFPLPKTGQAKTSQSGSALSMDCSPVQLGDLARFVSFRFQCAPDHEIMSITEVICINSPAAAALGTTSCLACHADPQTHRERERESEASRVAAECLTAY